MKVTLLFCLVCLNSVLGGDDLPHELGKLSSESLSISSRIYGGRQAEDEQFPYMVMVLMRTGKNEMQRCSASRVANDWVLIAAKCIPEGVTEKDLILVGGKAKLGEYINTRLTIPFDAVIDDNIFNTEERRAKNVYRHPNYTDGQYHDNIALIELKTPFTDKVPPLKISPDKNDRQENCTILGWGVSDNSNDVALRYAVGEKAVTPSVGCASKINGSFYCLEDASKGICKGDIGAPLICDGMAWGVASHFVPESVLVGCGRNSEQYYIEIYPYISWLNKYLTNSSSALTLSGTVHVMETNLYNLDLTLFFSGNYTPFPLYALQQKCAFKVMWCPLLHIKNIFIANIFNGTNNPNFRFLINSKSDKIQGRTVQVVHRSEDS
ncbi:hypothetical protein RUM43_003084 [Polyplax serrata]|uniref:Peptidase S1 domain-containing protein n=1 Tax=Polyplax serrata TaxID=468196 RepID=A0AAN8PEV3_POLSC